MHDDFVRVGSILFLLFLGFAAPCKAGTPEERIELLLARAVKLALSEPVEVIRDDLLRNISSIQLQRGNFGTALSTAKRISNEGSRAVFTASLVDALGPAQAATSPRTAAAELQTLLASARSPSDTPRFRWALGLFQEKVGDGDAAVRTLLDAPDALARLPLLQRLGRVRIEAGAPDRALSVADALERILAENSAAIWQPSSVLQVAELRFRAGDRPGSGRLLRQVLAKIREVPYAGPRAERMAEVASKAFLLGDKAGAARLYRQSIALARSVGDARQARGLLDRIAMMRCEAGDYAGGLSVAEELGPGFDRATMLSRVVYEMCGHVRTPGVRPAEPRLLSAASRLASTLPACPDREDCLERLAIQQSSRGDFGGALQSARAVSKAFARAMILSEVASVAATSAPAVEARRSLEEARRAAAEVASPAEAAELRPLLAAAEALGGQMDRALARVSELPVRDRAPGLQAVALAMATRARGLARYDDLKQLDEAMRALPPGRARDESLVLMGRTHSCCLGVASAENVVHALSRPADKIAVLNSIAASILQAGGNPDGAVSCLRWALQVADPRGTGEVWAIDALSDTLPLLARAGKPIEAAAIAGRWDGLRAARALIAIVRASCEKR